MSSELSHKPDSLMYKPVQQHNGRYRMRQLQLNNTQISNVTFTASGNSLLEWIFPAGEVFNPARSNFQYLLTIPGQGAALASFAFDDTFEICNSITVGTAAKPTDLLDLNYANNYVSVGRKIDTDIEDFFSGDAVTGLTASSSRLAPGTTVANRIAAAALGEQPNYYPPTFQTGANGVVSPLGVPDATYQMALSSGEPQYARSTPALNGALSIPRVVPFAALTHTFLGMDKDVCFAEDIYVRVMLAGSYKLGYTTVTAGDTAATPANFTVQPTITALFVNLAMQADEEIKAAVIAKMARGEMKFMIPYQVGWRQTTAAAGQAAINVNVNRSYGKKLKRFLYVPFDISETTAAGANAHKAYDHHNVSSDKITVYQTLLASKPLQDQQLVCATLDDYRVNRDLIRRSPLRTLAAYQTNWFHCDSWCQPKRGTNLTPDENIYEGLDLTDANQTWTLNATTREPLNHYVFAEFIREVHAKPLSQGGLEVVVA